jgi:hypothetical protein
MNESKKKESVTPKAETTIIDDFSKSLNDLAQKIDAFVYPLIIPPRESIGEDTLFNIYPDLKKIGKPDKLHILLYSYGGDAHTAFHIGRLLQEFSGAELKIYILREAKSAATLLATAANSIVFTDISELGPMDPQIQHPRVDKRFSPLAIKYTLDLLHGESINHTEVLKTLAEKLPDPMTLGEALKSLDTGQEYLQKLLIGRMFKIGDEEKVKTIAQKLVTGYPDHGYCIDFQEARDIGLNVEKVPPAIETEIYQVMRNFKDIWDKFERHFSRLNKPEDTDEDFQEALSLLLGLRNAATDIVNVQLERSKTPKKAPAKKAKASASKKPAKSNKATK